MRENLFRSAATFELRAATEGEMPTMVVNFARFGEWTEIRSMIEGHFMERFAPGSFKKTFDERGDKIRTLFQHGQDPTIGKKPLGSVSRLWEDEQGAWGEVDLLDADYVRELIPGLKANLYGASHQFKPVKMDDVKRPTRSEQNPDGIPEVTVTEAMLREFGPVTFGQYEGATAGIRSLTDDFLFERLLAERPDRIAAVTEVVSGSIGGRIGLALSGDTDALQRVLTNVNDDEREEPTPAVTPALAIARRRHALLGRRWTEPGATHSH